MDERTAYSAFTTLAYLSRGGKITLHYRNIIMTGWEGEF